VELKSCTGSVYDQWHGKVCDLYFNLHFFAEICPVAAGCLHAIHLSKSSARPETMIGGNAEELK